MAAPVALDRFLAAQELVYARVVEELRAGRKKSHWMWFIFPQLKGLGVSDAATYYGLDDVAEAAAYLAHPVLGGRLRECTAVVNALAGVTAQQIFGMPDTLKFRSSMTLFELVAEADSPFTRALEHYFGGRRDDKTLTLAGRS